MANPGNPDRGEPGFSPPSPTRPPDQGQDPLPEPVGVPMLGQDDMPPMNEPPGRPGRHADEARTCRREVREALGAPSETICVEVAFGRPGVKVV